MEDANEIRKKNNPNADFVEGMAKANAAFSRGFLTQGELSQERQRLLDEAMKSKKSETNRIAPSLLVGSQEAYAALIAASETAKAQKTGTQEKLVLLAKENGEIAKETNRILTEIKDASLGDAG